MVPDVDELADGDPVEVARENARRKAEAVEGDEVRCSAWTRSWCSTARSMASRVTQLTPGPMLETLSGREHEVVSGLALRRDGHTEVDSTRRPA